MTDFELKYSEKSVREYIKQSFFGGSVVGMLPTVLCAGMLTAIPIVGLIGWIMLHQDLLLIVSICALALDAIIVLVISLLIKKYTKKLSTALRAFDGLVCCVSEKDIIFVRDNAPQNIISWDDVDEISEGKTAFFIRTSKGFIIILEKDCVLSGTLEEATEIINKKLNKK